MTETSIFLDRTHRFAILGMSLSSVFDITSATDLLKGLLNILNEYDQSKDENYRPKMVRPILNISVLFFITQGMKQRLFRTSKLPKRQAGGVNDYTISLTESGDASYLITPHMVQSLSFPKFLATNLPPALPARLPSDSPLPSRHSFRSLPQDIKGPRTISVSALGTIYDGSLGCVITTSGRVRFISGQ